MWYLSSRKGRNFKYTPIFSLLASVNCSLRCLFLPGYCREILSTSVRFVILQADIHMSLWLCVPGVVGVDMFLCYYILQEQFFHPHPDGFYPTRWGLEGSSWGKDGASQTTSVFSRGKKKKIQVHNYSLKWIKMRVYDAGYVTKPVVYQQRWVKSSLLDLANE